MIKNWISAFRLRTLPLALSTIGMGIFLSFLSDLNDLNSINYSAIILLVLTTVALQILSNLANDYGDGIKGTDNENRVGPKRAVQSNLISKNQMKNGVIITALISFILGLMLIYFTLGKADWNQILFFIILGLSSIFAAILYTVGKRAYGYSGLGDIFVFLFFGIVGVGGSFYLLTLKVELIVLLPASFIGLLSAAVLNMNNMRDVENDGNSNKNTLVVTMGFEKAKLYHAFLIFSAFISWGLFCFLTKNYTAIITLLPFVILFKNVVTVFKTNVPSELDKELKKIALSTFGSTILFGVSILYN
jgi:1,4-dihydroxy-2-naphthoate octaprenyltransferase